EYRKMRHSRLPMFRARAMNAFRRNCELLRPYRNHFWSANVVTGLGERVLKEMERAANTLSKDNTPPVMIPTSKAASSSSAAADAAAAPRPETISPSQTNGLPSAMDTVIDSAVGFDHNVDFSMVNPVSGQDVFGHIDPN
ncbi:hypothetical protein, partial [Staphylococcus aureus]|uniref:hypothetical protein n=1 Tax=Staphylococcus aureus TaxID=1280 RepID=UPI0021091490